MWIQIEPAAFEKEGVEYIRARIKHYQDLDTEDAGKYFAAAKEHQVDGDLEFDDDAVVSPSGDGGAYVMGWKWVYDDEAGIEQKEEGTE